jgi:ABC-2 type transport system ATP-binding protein
MEHAVEIRGARKRYRGFELDGVSFDVPRGYIMGLIGPNGAGKTTIIKLILNLIRRDGGEIRAFSMDVCREEAAVKARIGYVSDAPAYYDDMSAAAIASAAALFYPRWDQMRFQTTAREFDLPLEKSSRRFPRA